MATSSGIHAGGEGMSSGGVGVVVAEVYESEWRAQDGKGV